MSISERALKRLMELLSNEEKEAFKLLLEGKLSKEYLYNGIIKKVIVSRILTLESDLSELKDRVDALEREERKEAKP